MRWKPAYEELERERDDHELMAGLAKLALDETETAVRDLLESRRQHNLVATRDKDLVQSRGQHNLVETRVPTS